MFKKTVISIHFFFIFILLFVSQIQAQVDQLTTQHNNNYLLINPAYAGMHNAIATNLSSRQQWVGIDGAPISYSLTIHSPINKTYTSIGGALKRYEQGPVTRNQVEFNYSYLIKFNAPVMLSLGLGASLSQTHIGFKNLNALNYSDPYIQTDYENGIKPNFGFGAFLYTPDLYIGISIPRMLTSNYKNNNYHLLKEIRAYYLTGGYTHKFNRKWSGKPSFLLRYADNGSLTTDISGQLQYRNNVCFGVLYRFNQTAALMLHLNVTENMGVCYSFEMPVNFSTRYTQPTHEISITYDIFQYYRHTKHRRFNKKSTEIPEGMKSMRFF